MLISAAPSAQQLQAAAMSHSDEFEDEYEEGLDEYEDELEEIEEIEADGEETIGGDLLGGEGCGNVAREGRRHL